MNAQPHTHKLEIERRWAYNNSGCWVLRYGDQCKSVWRGPWLKRRLRRAAKKIVLRHDRALVTAGQRAAARGDLHSELRAIASTAAQEWRADSEGVGT